MGAMASQITSLRIVYSTVYSGADQRKYQSSAPLAFVRGIYRWPVNSIAQMASNAESVPTWWRHHIASALHNNTHCLLLPHPPAIKAEQWVQFEAVQFEYLGYK